MANDTARILASCLEAIEQLGLSPEECLARYPDQRTALSELLPVAQALRSAPTMMPSLDFRLDARRRLLAQLPARQSRRTTRLTRPALFARAVMVFLLLVGCATSVATTSAQALPNDILYPMKRTIEQIRLAFATDDVHSSKLHLAFATERLNEVERLIELGRGGDASAALEDLVSQIQSVVLIAQTMPATTERAGLIARVTESIKSSDGVLSATQARLPESAQDAVTRARAILAKGQDDLRRTLQPAVTMTPVGAALDQSATRPQAPTLPRTSPTAMPGVSTLRPLGIGQPTDLPEREATARPIRSPEVWPTQRLPQAAIAPRVIPTFVPPIAEPTRLPFRVPMIGSLHFLTPVPRLLWPESSHHH